MVNGPFSNTFMSPDFQKLAANGTFGPMPGMPAPSSLSLAPSFGIGASAKMQEIKNDMFIRSEKAKAEKSKKTKWLLTIGGIVLGVPLLLGALSKGKVNSVINNSSTSATGSKWNIFERFWRAP